MGVGLDIIEPCGFAFDDRKIRRVAMDYLHQAEMTRHMSWQKFVAARQGRLVLFTTKARIAYTDFAFAPEDSLLFGQESCGVPSAVAKACDARVTIPIRPETRSLNVALVAAMAIGEAVRQARDVEMRRFGDVGSVNGN